jgi:hypothetical protein
MLPKGEGRSSKGADGCYSMLRYVCVVVGETHTVRCGIYSLIVSRRCGKILSGRHNWDVDRRSRLMPLGFC